MVTGRSYLNYSISTSRRRTSNVSEYLLLSKLLRHASIQMTERYAHLAPDHLHGAVANLGFSAHFQHTEEWEQTGAY